MLPNERERVLECGSTAAALPGCSESCGDDRVRWVAASDLLRLIAER